MRKLLYLFGCWSMVACQPNTSTTTQLALYEMDPELQTRWSSPENRNGKKGAGGQENYGAKGHPCDSIGAGATYTLLDIAESGIIHRIWITVADKSPEMLRSMRLDMYWDGATEPAVSVPLGDFFGNSLAELTAFENEFFANPEGRSFNSYIPMPFRKGARITVTNESDKKQPYFFFDVDYSVGKKWKEEVLYFHAYWNRDTATRLAQDYSILPALKGQGRFLGVQMSVAANPKYKESWFGEGEVKIYLDGDSTYPTLNGTGLEDYIGTAWGQGKFIQRYTGSVIADTEKKQWSFYRFHVPDPVFFREGCRVTIQTLGGGPTKYIAELQEQGAPMIPVIQDVQGVLHRIYEPGKVVQLNKADTVSWTNYYRSDDYTSTAYFYLNRPTHELAPLAPRNYRVAALRAGK